MRTALCTLDGVIYRSADFAQIENFDNKKNHLICPECRMHAFYRRPSRNGRDACFVARPHAEGCTHARPEHEETVGVQGNRVTAIHTTVGRIIVNLNYGTPEAAVDDQPIGGNTETAVIGGTNGQGNAERETTTRRLSRLLRLLIESEEFRRSPQIIEIPERGEFTVGDFFVRFPDVTENHIDTFHGFWGTIQNARRGTRGTLWFNSGEINADVSALLDRNFIRTVYENFNIENDGDLAGAEILVLGTLRLATNGKRCVQIEAPAYVTIRLAR